MHTKTWFCTHDNGGGMEVRPGYKRTEIGIIPDDWELKSLPEASWFQEGPGLRNWQFTSSGMKVINVTNLENGVLNLDRTDRHISLDEFDQMYRHFAIDASDIVMASSGNSYSKVAVVREQDLPLVMNTSVIRFKPSKLCEYGFLWFLLTSPQFKAQIDLMITGGAQPNFGPYHLKRVVVPLPSLNEQRAIAQALSEVDALLATLDQVIAKKRDLRQATMQKLLTGETRLPRFYGEWLEKSLSNTATLKARIGWQGLTTAEYLDAGDYLLVTGTDFKNSNIDWRNCHYVTEERYSQDKNIQLQLNDVLVTKDGTIGKVALISELPSPATLNSGVFVIRPIKDAFQPSFFYFLLCSKVFTEFLNELCAGSTISHLYQKDFITFKYRTPPTLSEQAAIAKVLSDMDAELSLLESRRDKTRNIKQAMMQELLTGKTRLV